MENKEKKRNINLRAYRMQKQAEIGKKISSRQVALRMDKSPNYVSLLERGKAYYSKGMEDLFLSTVDQLAAEALEKTEEQ